MKELLESALNEIQSLRRQNELMKARLDMFDAVMSALHGQPALDRQGLMALDVAYELRKQIEELNKNEE